MRITSKRYRCDTCGTVFWTSTNHWSTIWRGCKHHYFSASTCVEAEEALKDAARDAGERSGEAAPPAR